MAKVINRNGHKYKVDVLKLMAQTIIDNAEDYVGTTELMTDLTVTINIPNVDGMYEHPTITISKDYYSRNVINYELDKQGVKHG